MACGSEISQGFYLGHPTAPGLGDDIGQTQRYNHYKGTVMSSVLIWFDKRQPPVTGHGTMTLVPENTHNEDVSVVVDGSS